MGCLWIQAHKGFIHHDKLRVVEPCGNDGKLLLHTVGVGGYGLGQIRGQFKGIRKRPNPFLAIPGGDPKNIRDKIQELNASHEIVQIRIIRYVGDFPFAGKRIRFYGYTVNQNISGIETQNTRTGFQRGRFACAVVTNEAINLTRADVQGQIIHCLLIAVLLCQMIDLNHDSISFPKTIPWNYCSSSPF